MNSRFLKTIHRKTVSKFVYDVMECIVLDGLSIKRDTEIISRYKSTMLKPLDM